MNTKTLTKNVGRGIAALGVIAMILGLARPSFAGLWQYSALINSVENGEIHDHPRAYLWIPPRCKHIRAVVVAQHNLLEESILLDPKFRATLAKLGIAEVWVMPNIDFVFDFNKGAGDAFNDMMESLAATSGYQELVYAPVVPLGHSAAASFPWNFAAWAPRRTLAVLSVHGDMPESNLTGSGRPNPDWGDRNIDGVPGLFAMGQYEWLDTRTQPGLDYVAKHPMTPLAMLPDIGHGHFDTSPSLVSFLCMFVTKAVEHRLPKNTPLDGPVTLTPIDPRQGWLVDRWEPGVGRRYPAAPYAEYTGDRRNAFWCFDREMAEATENYGKGRVLNTDRKIVYVQDGKVLAETPGAAGVMPRPKLEMDTDGRTFHFSAYEVNSSVAPGTDWTAGEAASVDAHQLAPRVLCGPVVKVDNSTYRLRFDQSGFNSPYRSFNTFLTTAIPDNDPEMVRSEPAGIFVARNKEGLDNVITFPAIDDVRDTRHSIHLQATSSSGLPVAYYVDSGPAEVDGDTLRFTPIPPRSRYPIEVRVVAWQWGKSRPRGEGGSAQLTQAVKSADPVVVTFRILGPKE